MSSPFFYLFAACAAQKTLPFLAAGSAIRVVNSYDFLFLDVDIVLMSAKFRLLILVVSTSGCSLWFGCMGTSPPSLWVTCAEIACAPFIPVYNAKLAINTGLEGALMVIDPSFVGQQKL